jgi:mercuric ion binding protein
MKIRIIACLVLLTGANQAQAQTKVAKINVKTSIYCDHCKQCESCGKRLYNAIHAEKGIRKVSIDPDQKSIEVSYNSQKTCADAIRKAIAKVGFDADDVKADSAAYEKLDDCCKKQ